MTLHKFKFLLLKITNTSKCLHFKCDTVCSGHFFVFPVFVMKLLIVLVLVKLPHAHTFLYFPSANILNLIPLFCRFPFLIFSQILRVQNHLLVNILYCYPPTHFHNLIFFVVYLQCSPSKKYINSIVILIFLLWKLVMSKMSKNDKNKESDVYVFLKETNHLLKRFLNPIYPSPTKKI
jgi:hypothetical protein